MTIVLGCLAAMFVLVMLASQAAAAAKATPTPVGVASILPVIAVYGGLAAVLICLGIGSIQARRWARALLLIFSWSWLLLGIMTTVMIGFIMPKLMGNVVAAQQSAGHPALPRPP